MNISAAEFAILEAKQAGKLRGKRAPEPQEASQGVERESELHDAINAECRRRGWIPLHGSMVHRAHRTVGEPDFVILADGGRLFLVEAKTKTGKVSEAQAALMAWAARLNHEVKVVRSMAEFLAVIDASRPTPYIADVSAIPIRKRAS